MKIPISIFGSVSETKQSDKNDRTVVGYNDDCALFLELNQRGRIDFSEMPKIKRANRGWRDFAHEERSKGTFIEVPYFHQHPQSVDEEIAEAEIFFAAGFLLLAALAILGGLSSVGLSLSIAIFVGLPILAVVTSYIFRLHQMVVGVWHWHCRKDKRRPRVLIDDVVDYLLRTLVVREPEDDFSAGEFNGLIDCRLLAERYAYLNSYCYNVLIKGGPKVRDGDDYSTIRSDITARYEEFSAVSEATQKQIGVAREEVADLKGALLTEYKEEAIEVRSFLVRMYSYHPHGDPVVNRTERILKESRDDVIGAFEQIISVLDNAADGVSGKLKKYQLLSEGELYPIPGTTVSPQSSSTVSE